MRFIHHTRRPAGWLALLAPTGVLSLFLAGCAGLQPAHSTAGADTIIQVSAPSPVVQSQAEPQGVPTNISARPSVARPVAAQFEAKTPAAKPRPGSDTVLIVDTEYKGKANRGVARIEAALHEAGATKTHVVHAWQLDEAFLKQHKPRALVLSGQGTPWWEYDKKELDRQSDVLRRANVPMLGICGGHQLLAIAFGGKVAPILKTGNGEGYAGCKRERGWLTLSLHSDALFRGGAPRKALWLNHCEEVKALPKDFVRIASDGHSANQAMRHQSKPIYGVQFHPEVANRTNGYGRRILKNFLAIVDAKKKRG